MIVGYNHSHDMVRKSGECVINLPTVELLEKVIGIGNCHGQDINKFEKFDLTALPGEEVKAPLIRECYANFECVVYDKKMLPEYSFFIFEVVKAHVPKSPKYPKTVHYTGDASLCFPVSTSTGQKNSGRRICKRSLRCPSMLIPFPGIRAIGILRNIKTLQ